MLPLETLRTFVAVAESGSFTGAGAAVHRTQSAVSMQIRRLERELGKALFTRGARGAELTEEGETLLRYARRILGLSAEALASVAGPELGGTVRLGAPEDYAQSLLPEVLAGFCGRHPQVRVEVLVEPSERLAQALALGRLDVCLRTCAERAEAGRVVRREPVVWAAATDHEPQLREPLPLAVYHQGCAYRRWALEALQSVGRTWRIVVQSPSLAGILAAVRCGLAVAPVGLAQVRDGLRVLGPEDGFPSLPEAFISVDESPAPATPAREALARHVARALAGA